MGKYIAGIFLNYRGRREHRGILTASQSAIMLDVCARREHGDSGHSFQTHAAGV